MKKITLLCFVFIALAFNFQINAQCTGTYQYPLADFPVSDAPGIVEISDCNFYGDYSVLTGISVGESYDFAIDPSGFITLIDDADGTTVLASGASPLTWLATVSDVQVHWHANAACATDTTCHISTMDCTTCTLPPAVPECADTPTPGDMVTGVITAGAVDISFVPSPTGEPADFYDIQWGTVSGALASIGTTVETTVTITGLDYDTTYYWMIVPTNALGPATGCEEWEFTTGSAPTTPTNDECDTAIPLVCGTPLLGTTDDPGATDSGANASADVWYVYENLGVVEDVTVSLCGSGYDTNLRVYSDCPFVTQLATNDDSCGLQSELTFTNDGVGTYYIMVEGYLASIGDFVISATCDVSIPAPANDNCDASEALVIGVTSSGTTAGATDQGTGVDDDTTCDPFDFHADVWYSVTLSGGPNDLTITTTTTGSSDEAGISIYPDECDFLDASSIICGGGDDPAGGSVTAVGLADGTYYVRVWSNGIAARTNSRIEGTFDIVADATLSTTDFDNALGFSYYPNPVTHNLTLNAQNNIDNVFVYNMLGQEVMRVTPNQVKSDLDMSELQSGTYFVKVSINSNTKTIKIIKE